MKNWKRFISLGLATAMLLTTAACGGNDTDGEKESLQEEKQSTEQADDNSAGAENELAWLNTSGTLPIVAEGTEKTLSIYLCMAGGVVSEPEDFWFYDFIQDVMNINVEITPMTWDNRDEVISLAFASGELPDLIISAGLNANELVKYGAVEGQILDLAPYLNETYMPNLTAIYEKYPELKSIVQDSEGHVWSTGFVRDPNEVATINQVFLNYDKLDECNLEVPETLDEFYDMLVAFKELDESSYPLCGAWSAHNPGGYILNAFGYVGADNAQGLSIALRNGKVVLPVADREAYGAFLTFMNKLYEEGLMHPDFFTMDSTTVEGLFKEGKFGTWDQMVALNTDDVKPWWGALPLTSEYNDTAQWPARAVASSCGQGVVTTECEEPELAAAFLDWFYTYHNYMLSSNGAIKDVDPDEWLCGAGGRSKDETGEWVHNDVVNNVDGWTSSEYVTNKIRLIPAANLGSYIEDGDERENALYPYIEDYADIEDISVLRNDETLLKNTWWYCIMALDRTLNQYRTTDVFPGVVYLDADTTEYISGLKAAIDEYATQETAKFITGARPLDELDDYFDEIERLGADEYVQVYQEYYDSIQ